MDPTGIAWASKATGSPSVADQVLGDGIQAPKESLQARHYQLEMLEESLQRNIIVAMDTGSGKTLIAIMRIQAELERCSPNKRVWFCVPSAALALQQHRCISEQLPAFQSRVLLGADNCEFWTEQWIWDDILHNIRIVVSTHQILLDALGHGLVKMQELALLVFDEAHHAVKSDPANRIMQRFYHGSDQDIRPSVLGLTASPLINSKIGNLGILESNLDAISRTPKLHRAELMQCVHQPILVPLRYSDASAVVPSSQALISLIAVYAKLRVEDDPWVIRMKSNQKTENSPALNEVLLNNKTYSHEQLRNLHHRAQYIAIELGPWAANNYIYQCVHKFCTDKDDAGSILEHFEDEERKYLQRKLADIIIPDSQQLRLSEPSSCTEKVNVLINYLSNENIPKFSGLVFVQTRAEVAILSHLLSVHPSMAGFSISTFIGISSYSGRKSKISDLAEVRNQKTTLEDFREGRRNLVVTTNALEEGIDVASCNVVICFQKPPNLKSFIQRRGRARNSASKYVLMFGEAANPMITRHWMELEEIMRKQYEDDMRQIMALEQSEDSEGDSNRVFSVESTGAQITLADAISHLYHFCNTLTEDIFIDPSPIFFYADRSSNKQEPAISARVLLPTVLDASVQEAHSKILHKTEKNARRDAAFEAYVALYRHGLVNDHLLPVGHVDPKVEAAYSEVEKRPNLVLACDQLNLWSNIAQRWSCSDTIQASQVVVRLGNEVSMNMSMLLPVVLPDVADFDLYWNSQTTFQVSVHSSLHPFRPPLIDTAKQITALILHSIFPSRMKKGRDDFIALFVPHDIVDLQDWRKQHIGSVRAQELQDIHRDSFGLVKDMTQNSRAHKFCDVRYVAAEDLCSHGFTEVDSFQATDQKLHGGRHLRRDLQLLTDPEKSCGDIERAGKYIILEVTRMPKRADFLHLDTSTQQFPEVKWLLAEKCNVDRLPFRFSQFAMLIPSILHKVHVTMIAEQLSTTLLSPLNSIDRSLVTTAISTPAAREATNYQRFEFLGDSILKMITSLALMASHLNYHQGILSHMKDHVVSNSSLANAALRTGLDKFILTKPFTGAKWKPSYNSELLEEHKHISTREISSKTLADVVEALVGAAYLDGGLEKALSCTQVFLPKVSWVPFWQVNNIFHNLYKGRPCTSSYIANAEKLLQYSFRTKSLLIEAITHASYRGPNASAPYERLEFLGDSILDNIVTVTAFKYQPEISVPKLHLIRAALVNADFLGYLCFQHFIDIEVNDPVSTDSKDFATNQRSIPMYLWQILRHSSPTISLKQRSSLTRLNEFWHAISADLQRGKRHPWALLARFEPPKPFSDLIESIVAAIYIDAGGSLEPCTSFLRHIGLMDYLTRVLETEAALLHPKEELGQLSNQDDVRYVMSREDRDGVQRLACTILVGGEEVARASDGLNSVEVQTRAAVVACEVLKRAHEDNGRQGQGRLRDLDQRELEDIPHQQVRHVEEGEEGELTEESIAASYESDDHEDTCMHDG